MMAKWLNQVQPLWCKVIHLKFDTNSILKRCLERIGNGRSRSSQRDEKLPTLAQVNREICDKSSELLGRREMVPAQLVDWISDKRGRQTMANLSDL